MSHDRMTHPFEPSEFNEKSKVLILGSFPSPESREYGFYYGDVSNRFWKVLENLFQPQIPITRNKSESKSNQEFIKAQKDFLKQHNLVVWDIVQSRDKDKSESSKDSDIKNEVANDLSHVLHHTPNLHLIILNGKKTADTFCKFYGYHYDNQPPFTETAPYRKILTPKQQTESTPLSKALSQCKIYLVPSTSQASERSSVTFEKLLESWKILKEI